MKQKSLIKNTIFKAILSLFNIAIPLIVGPYIVRLLDVKLYGIYNSVFSEFQLFLTFASFGIYTFGVREISKIRDDDKAVSKLFTNLFVITVITNLIVLGIYIAYSCFVSTGITRSIYLVMVIQIIGNIFYIEFTNEALENYKFITIKTAIVKIFYLIALFVFVKKADDIIIYSIIISLTVFANNIVSFIYVKRRIKFDFSELKFKKHLISMFYILIITNVELLYGQLDRVMLGKYINGVQVTSYYIPYFIVSTLAAIPYSLIMVSIPRLSYMVKNTSKHEYTQMLNKIISSLLFMIIPMCFGVFVLSKEIILLYAGNKYAEIYPALMIASMARIITTLESVMTHLVMYPNGKERKVAVFCCMYGILNLLSNGALIYSGIFEYKTAMLTTAIADMLFTITELIYARHSLNIKIKIITKATIKYLILSVMFIPVAFIIKSVNMNLPAHTILVVLSCAMLYTSGLMIFHDENLIECLKKIKMKIG